jgi:hypothetical protein
MPLDFDPDVYICVRLSFEQKLIFSSSPSIIAGNPRMETIARIQLL